MLDLSHIHLATYGIARFATKRQALALVRERGWNTCDVIQAFNRFQIFWVVGDRMAETGLRLATQQPGTIEVPPYRAAQAA
jgi:hypothetical protein